MQSMKKIPYRFLGNHFARNSSASSCETDKLKSWDEIPGPSSLPFIGPLHHLIFGAFKHGGDMRKLWENLVETYGPIIKLGAFLDKPPMVMLRDPEAISQIIRGEDTYPHRISLDTLDFYRKEIATMDGPFKSFSGLLSDQGEKWRQFRSTVNPVLMRPKTIKLYTDAMDEVAKDMINSLRQKRNSNNMFDGPLTFEMKLWSLESVSVVSMGTRLHCFNSNLPDDSPAKRLVQCTHDIISLSGELDMQPSIWKWFTTPKFRKLMKAYDEQTKLSKYYIDKTLDSLKNNKNDPEGEKSVLEKLTETDPNIAYIMASDMLMAGVDTTSNTVLGVMYLLAKNKDKQKILREELKIDPERRYLKACIREAMRMMTIVIGTMRLTSKEYNILGYRIPKGSHMMFLQEQIHLSEKYFLRPTEFLPERFLVDKEDPLSIKNSHTFAWLPFGYGIRSCIGRRVAELALESFVARYVENFESDWVGPPPKVKHSTVIYIKEPFNLVYKDI